MTREQIPTKLPPPKDKRGYTTEEIKTIFGSNVKTVLKELECCTVIKNKEGEILVFPIDVKRAWDILRKGYSGIPWD